MKLSQAESCDRDVPTAKESESGITAGLVGGTWMAIALGLQAAGSGEPFLHPFQLIFSGLMRTDPASLNWGFALAGLALHFGVSIALGAALSFLLHCQIPGVKSAPAGDRAFASGALFAVAVWAVMTFAVLPWLNPVFRGYVMGFSSWWFVDHVIYGSALSLIPGLRAALYRREMRSRQTQSRKAA